MRAHRLGAHAQRRQVGTEQLGHHSEVVLHRAAQGGQARQLAVRRLVEHAHVQRRQHDVLGLNLRPTPGAQLGRRAEEEAEEVIVVVVANAPLVEGAHGRIRSRGVDSGLKPCLWLPGRGNHLPERTPPRREREEAVRHRLLRPHFLLSSLLLVGMAVELSAAGLLVELLPAAEPSTVQTKLPDEQSTVILRRKLSKVSEIRRRDHR